jgi:DNA-binding NarL/FixJ family response regulator
MQFINTELSSSYRQSVIHSSVEDSDAADCCRIFGSLVAGECSILDSFALPARAYLVLAPGSARNSGILPRDLEILHRVLLGASPKVVASDLLVSPSTVAASLKRALEAFGYHGRPSSLPLGLVMLARAANHDLSVCMQRSAIQLDDTTLEVLTAPIPSLTTLLSPAVCDVVFMHAQGRSHAEIAASRRTSRRTVANQLAVAFNRLGLSGRSALLHYLTVPRLQSVTLRTSVACRISRPAESFASPLFSAR